MKRLKEIIRFAGYFVLGGIIIIGFIAVFSPDDKEAILDLDNLDITQVSEEKIINVVEYGNLEAGEHKKGKSTGIKGDYADYDYDNCRYSIEKCTGIFTVSSTEKLFLPDAAFAVIGSINSAIAKQRIRESSLFACDFFCLIPIKSNAPLDKTSKTTKKPLWELSPLC